MTDDLNRRGRAGHGSGLDVDAVDALPLHRGRAELLEEIMITPVLDTTPVRRSAPRRAARYLVPLAAAAAVAALATVPLWTGDSAPADPTGFAAPSATPEGPAYLPLLDTTGWRVSDAATGADGGSVEFTASGGRSLEANWYPADLYDGYVEDRRHIVDPPADGDPVEVGGVPAQMWAYSRDDHTAIREVVDGRMLELRGEGMGREDYLDLLAQVRLVGLEEFEEALPASFITTTERPAAVQEVLDQIADALAPQPLLPDGRDAAEVESAATDRYYLGVDVAGAVACAWLESYVTATGAGDEPSVTAAQDALATTRQWAILQEMKAEGDYPEVLWDYADYVVDGNDPEGYAGALGCP